MNFADWLNFLRGPGINAALGVAISFIVEWFPGFATAAPRIKRLVLLGICLAIPTLATVGLVLLGALDPKLPDTWFMAVMAGAMAYGGSAVAHLRDMGTGGTRALDGMTPTRNVQ